MPPSFQPEPEITFSEGFCEWFVISLGGRACFPWLQGNLDEEWPSLGGKGLGVALGQGAWVRRGSGQVQRDWGEAPGS